MEIYFHQTFQLKLHNLTESKHLSNMFQAFLNAPLLAAHHTVLVNVKSSTRYPVLKEYCFSSLITQPTAMYDRYPQSTDESDQKVICPCSHGDALVDKRAKPSCSLTSALSVCSISFADNKILSRALPPGYRVTPPLDGLSPMAESVCTSL